MHVLRRIYSFWCYFWFLGLFLLLFPFFFIFLQKEKWHPKAHYLNRLWGKLFFPICFLPVSIEYREKIKKNQPYIFCANHTSILDIAVMGVIIDNFFAFVGKRELAKVPLFGYMFTKLHITVDRTSRVSSYRTMTKTLETLDKGRSIMIFPEGGIVTKNPPQLTPFKDGPFRMAIEKQVPIVPITLPYNWIILPDDGRLLFHRKPIKAIVHESITTKGMTMGDLPRLKQMTFETIDNELQKFTLITTPITAQNNAMMADSQMAVSRKEPTENNKYTNGHSV
jgi:1-acyl-sn-glycerol-3-phosphate acyltransferase